MNQNSVVICILFASVLYVSGREIDIKQATQDQLSSHPHLTQKLLDKVADSKDNVNDPGHPIVDNSIDDFIDEDLNEGTLDNKLDDTLDNDMINMRNFINPPKRCPSGYHMDRYGNCRKTV